MAVVAQGADHAFFLKRRKPGKNSGVFRGILELLLAQPVKLVPGDQLLDIQPDVRADFAGDKFVVAGQHLEGHTQLVHALNGGAGAGLGGIEKCQVALEREFALVFLGVSIFFLVDRFVGDRQHAETVGTEVVVFLLQIRQDQIFHFVNFTVKFIVAAALENFFGSAFRNQRVLPIVLDDDGHNSPGEIKGDLVVLFIAIIECDVIFKNGAVQKIFEAGLMKTVQIGVF